MYLYKLTFSRIKSHSKERNYTMEKIKISKQRILVATLTLCMLFTLFAPAANVNAASKRTKALTAYQKKLKKLDSKIYKFALVYLDKDSIPELLITPDFSVHAVAGEVYTYTGGKLKQLKYAGSDYGRLIYSKKKSVVSNSALMDMAPFQHFIVLTKREKERNSKSLKKPIFQKLFTKLMEKRYQRRNLIQNTKKWSKNIL